MRLYSAATAAEMLVAWFKFVMFFVWVAAEMLACWAWEVARMFARRMEKEALRAKGMLDETRVEIARWPRAAVILPIKGVEDDTQANIQALLRQDYPEHRLLFAVESEADPVVGLLERMAKDAKKESRVPVEIVVAGLATERGQKVHNQLAAIGRTGADDEVLVFMDADANPSPTWLRELIRPLAESGRDGEVGASTGFRFYVPEVPGKCFANTMASVINAGVAALLGPGWRNVAWGGSMALWRENFFSFGIHEAWQHALSDDYVLSWCVKNKAKKKIQFAPGCLVASSAEFTWASFWEFAARQYRITKICAPAIWLTAIGASVIYLVALAYTLIFFLLSVFGVSSDSLTGRVDYFLLVMFLALYVTNFMRGRFLLQGGVAAFPEKAEKLRAIGFWYTWGYPVNWVMNLMALLRAAVGRTIAWRGVRYVMRDRFETRVER